MSDTDDSDKPKAKRRQTARRGYGEGSLFQRADGKWVATITVGYNADGKRKRITVYGGSKKEVSEKLTRLQNEKLDGKLIDSGKMTVGELIDRWLSESAKINTANNTYTRYESVSRIHIKPLIGAVKLKALRPLNVQTMLADMVRNGIGQRTRGHCYAVLRRALNVGLRWGLVVRNVCDAVDPPKQTKSEVETLNAEQVRQLLAATDGTRWHALFTLAITAGMRQGELFALHWSDVDLKSGVLSVRKSLEEVKGQLKLKEPKSKSGRRQIALPQMAVQALWDHKSIMLAEGLAGCELVFCDSDGKFLRKSNFTRRAWAQFRDAVKIPKTITFHDLRHTSATILLAAGIHPKIVQERLGHASIQLTMDTYSHVLPTIQQAAAATFENIRDQKLG